MAFDPEEKKFAFQTRTNAAINGTNEKVAVLAARLDCHYIDYNGGIKDEKGT